MAKKFRFWSFSERSHYESDVLEQVSCTAIKAGLECRKRLYLMLTTPKPPKNHYLTMGSVFHAVMEHYFKEKARTGADTTWQALVSIFEREWAKNSPGTVWGEVGEASAKMKCANIIKVYLTGCKTLIPIERGGIERFICFTARQGDRSIKITGKVDLVCKGGHVVDHKSGQVRNPEEEPQAQLYPLGLSACGVPVSSFQFRVVDGVLVKSMPVKFDQEKANKFLSAALEFQKDFSEGVFLENRKSCRFCDYRQHCGI